MTDPQNPDLVVDKEAKQLIENTESVVHQTYNDISGPGGIGEVVDDSKAQLEILLKEFRTFKANYKSQIEFEVSRQIKPLKDELERLISKKPNLIFVLPKLPKWVKFILRIK